MGHDEYRIEQIRDRNARWQARSLTRKPWRHERSKYKGACCQRKTETKHHCLRHLLREVRYHSTNENGLMSNLESTTLPCLYHNSSLLSIGLTYLHRGGVKKRFQYCLEPNSRETILYLRAIQVHSGGSKIDPTLQDNVILPYDISDHIYHVGSSHGPALHHPPRVGCQWKRCQKGQTDKYSLQRLIPCLHIYRSKRNNDLNKPRIAIYKQYWEVLQNTLYWVNLRVAQKQGWTFYETRSNAIILHDPLPASCIERVVVMSSEEVLNSKMYESPRPPQKNGTGTRLARKTMKTEERTSWRYF